MIAGPRILITDDDAELRETLRSVFEVRGFHTFLAEDGEQALHIVRRERPHLVLVDMHMPKLTGLETLERVRELNASIPCILMSAALDELLVRQARLAHAASVLAKPITRTSITAAVERALSEAYDWAHDLRAVRRTGRDAS